MGGGERTATVQAIYFISLLCGLQVRRAVADNSDACSQKRKKSISKFLESIVHFLQTSFEELG